MKHILFIIILFLTLLSCSRRETIFIDDVEQSKEQLERLNSSEIFSYTKYRPGEAPPHYYKGNDTTVIVVKTKKVETRLQKQRHALLNRFLDSVDIGKDILMVLNGIMVSKDLQLKFRKLSADQLDNVMTMELQAAKELYGPPARPITLVINTYDPKFQFYQ